MGVSPIHWNAPTGRFLLYQLSLFEGVVKHWLFLLLIVLQPLIYFNGLNGEFVFDDQFYCRYDG